MALRTCVTCFSSIVFYLYNHVLKVNWSLQFKVFNSLSQIEGDSLPLFRGGDSCQMRGDGCQIERGTLCASRCPNREFLYILIIKCYFCLNIIYKYYIFLMQYYSVFWAKKLSGNIIFSLFLYSHLIYFFRHYSELHRWGWGGDRYFLFRGDFFFLRWEGIYSLWLQMGIPHPIIENSAVGFKIFLVHPLIIFSVC